ncbi:MAG: DUF1587 domain-containing protein [Planctomycetaceae bacterium]
MNHRFFAVRLLCLPLSCFLIVTGAFADNQQVTSFPVLKQEYTQSIQPLLKQYCNDCHSTAAKEGELDLERYADFDHIRQDPAPWQKVISMVHDGEMPPDESPQLTDAEQQQLLQWVRKYLDAEAFASAGDPGPVVLRRLNNAEYTYTINDLTGLNLNPAEQFPVDGAAGEGFTNTGAALVMSPSLVTKYFDAAKGIAEHLVLLPDGIRFSPGNSRRDFTDEIVAEIRDIYISHTGPLGDASKLDQWNVGDTLSLTQDDGRVDLARYLTVLLENRESLQSGKETFAQVAQREEVNAKYLEILGTTLNAPADDSQILNQLRQHWKSITPEKTNTFLAEIRAWQQQLWKYNKVGQFGSVRPWQEGVNRLHTSLPFQTATPTGAGEDALTIYISANGAGSKESESRLRLNLPRFVRPGQSPILLKDIRALSILMEEVRTETFLKLTNYLAAVAEYRQQTTDNQEAASLTDLAERYQVDPLVLESWVSLLGLGENKISPQNYLHVAYQDPKRPAVNGWGYPDAPALMLLSNSSEETLRIPGVVEPHQIVVHPFPNRWVAAGWQAPAQGMMRIEAEVQRAHMGWGMESPGNSNYVAALNANCYRKELPRKYCR